jgi:hypothetical protein
MPGIYWSEGKGIILKPSSRIMKGMLMNNTCLILYLSSTSAQAAAVQLRAWRIPCEVTKPPASLTGGSCSYALNFPGRYLNRVRALLDTAGGLYCSSGGGWHRA